MYQQPVQSLGLLQSFVCGRTHGDTQIFDDVAQLHLDPNSTHIQRIEVEYDSLIYGFTVTYRLGTGTIQTVQHLGNGRGHRRKAVIDLEHDELITHISGRHGDVFDHLKISTNKGKIIDVGGHGGAPFDLAIPQNYTALGFKGGLGGHIHNLALILKPIVQQCAPQMSQRAGHQHPDTSPWDDMLLLQGASSTQITEIKALSDGQCVLGLEVHYMINGVEHRTSGWHVGPHHQSHQRLEQVLRLRLDEFIVAIEGRCGNVIDHLKIVTNFGQELSIGGHGGNHFSIPIPPGRRVVAFGGGCGGHLHNLYVYFN